jgi:hypothetical protein
MLKLKKTCKVCQAVKQNKRLLNEIYNTKFYLKTRGTTLTEVSNKYPHLFTYDSLKNHVKKHQFIDEEDFTNRHLNQLAKQAQSKMLRQSIESKEVFNEIIGMGMEQLQAGNLQVKTKDLLSAAKYKKEFELKEKDQEIAMIDMVMHFASGENNNIESSKYDRRIIEGKTVTDYNPAEESPTDSERRETQSRAFYQSLTGDATPPGTD